MSDDEPSIEETIGWYHEALSHRDYTAAADLCRSIGYSFYTQQSFQDAISWHMKELDCCSLMSNRNLAKQLEAGARRFLGVNRMCLGDFDEAKRQHRQSLQIARSIGDEFERCTALTNLALTMRAQSKDPDTMEQCLTMYNRCETLASRAMDQLSHHNIERKTLFRDLLADCLHNAGLLLESSGRFALAHEKHFKAIGVTRTEDTERAVRSYRSIASCCGKLGRVAEAQKYFREAYQRSDCLVLRKEVCLDIAEYYKEIGRLDKSRKYLEKAVDIANKMGDDETVVDLTCLLDQENRPVKTVQPVSRKRVLLSDSEGEAEVKPIPSVKVLRYKIKVKERMLLVPVQTDTSKCTGTVRWLIEEVNRRCAKFFPVCFP